MEIRHLTYRYGNRVALNDFSCTLQPGICGLLGPNGAGKSTLMKLLCDLMPRDQGEILTSRGTDIRDIRAAYRAQLGYVPQQQGFYGSMSAYRFLLYMASLKKIPGKIAKTEIDQLLDLFHLTEDANRRLDTYSGGMKQRIMLSQAFLGNPRYLILDEPTVGLDPGEQEILCRYIRK